MAADPPSWQDQVKAAVRRRYGRLAATGDWRPDGVARAVADGYPADRLGRLPPGLSDAYHGCGCPLIGIDPRPLRLAVDLGCGAGLDACLLADSLRGCGRVVAVDLAPEMTARTAANAATAGIDNLAVLTADMERLPLADGTADLIIANAAFNLTVDKRAAFHEAFRILRPGGRLVACDLVRDRPLPPELMADAAAWNTSIGGVLSPAALQAALVGAGFAGLRLSAPRPFSHVAAVRIEGRRPG